MSFSSDIKLEISKMIPEKKCCQLAEIAGFLRFAGSITLSSGRMGVKVSTDNPAVARTFIVLVRDYFGAKSALSLGEARAVTRSRVYELNITADMNAEQILREVGILGVREGSNYITDGISQDVVRRRCCKKAALRGIFMASGSVSDPAKSYHMEIVCASEYMAQDVRKLVNSFGLRARTAPRKDKYIVYLKDGEQILDFLSILGCSSQLFRFQDVRIIKENKNRANRINNCESANLDKTVNAAQRQLEDIRVISSAAGLDVLPDKLRETALLRLENPELSLSELAELFDPPLKKSGLNHRFAKISEAADRYRSRRR
jgi:DNA-binding protein WhiA